MDNFLFTGRSSGSRTNIGSSPSSPIVRLSEDQVFTILLLLPTDSVLSFSMTCKKFRYLATFDTLWEAICRRDWGSRSLDALKSSVSRNNQQLSWMRLYKHVINLDSVSCHKLPDPNSQMIVPSSRASHSFNFVSDCLVLFGGGCEGGRHLDDTWVAYIGNGFQRMLEWQKVSSGIPSGRFGHTCVVIGDFLVLFGGINDRGDRQNDTWVGKVTFNDSFGTTLSWRMLDVGTSYPPPRGAHATSCIDRRKMVINGGIGMSGLRLADTWVLELSEDLHFGLWSELVTPPSPPALSGHTLTCIQGTGTVLFGGRGLGYEAQHDVWLLHMSEGKLKWTQLLFELQKIPQGISLPRVGHSATLILGGRVLIYGGEDSCRHRKDDFWVLDISTTTSTTTMQPTSLASQSLEVTWKRIKAKSYKPKCRSFHRACSDYSGCHLYVFGGMVDGQHRQGEGPGLRFDEELFVVELVNQL